MYHLIQSSALTLREQGLVAVGSADIDLYYCKIKVNEESYHIKIYACIALLVVGFLITDVAHIGMYLTAQIQLLLTVALSKFPVFCRPGTKKLSMRPNAMHGPELMLNGS